MFTKFSTDMIQCLRARSVKTGNRRRIVYDVVASYRQLGGFIEMDRLANRKCRVKINLQGTIPWRLVAINNHELLGDISHIGINVASPNLKKKYWIVLGTPTH